FGLLDEYGGRGVPTGEPPAPNVTLDTNRTSNKWRALILPTTPMPSQCEGSCMASTCLPPATPAAGKAVGNYEGAKACNFNLFRPVPRSIERKAGDPFCPVC